MLGFFYYFRISIISFDELLSYIENDIIRQDTNMRKAIQPEAKLVINNNTLVWSQP